MGFSLTNANPGLLVGSRPPLAAGRIAVGPARSRLWQEDRRAGAGIGFFGCLDDAGERAAEQGMADRFTLPGVLRHGGLTVDDGVEIGVQPGVALSAALSRWRGGSQFGRRR